MSFYSAEATQPCVADLAGLLCGQGQMASFAKTAARLSVVVDEPWRARALAAALADRGIDPEVARTDLGHPLVRTAFRHDLTALASAWTKGAVKAVPPVSTLHGAALRMWVLAAGHRLDRGYYLGLDARAPDTHETLADAVCRIGLPVSLVGVRGGSPGLRLIGSRRLARLEELIGDPPTRAAEQHWPSRTFVMRAVHSPSG